MKKIYIIKEEVSVKAMIFNMYGVLTRLNITENVVWKPTVWIVGWKAALLGNPFWGLLRAIIFWTIERMSGAHPAFRRCVPKYILENDKSK